MNFITLEIAFRYFRSKRRGFLSFLSVISFAGIAIGVAVLILVTSVMNGFERELQNKILQAIPHASIKGKPILDDWEKLNSVLRENKNIIGSAPYLETQAILNSKSNLKAVFIYGVNPKLEQSVSIISNNIIIGSWEDLQKEAFNISIGELLARKLDISLGDYLNVLVSDTSMGFMGSIPRTKKFRVSSIFSLGSPEFDMNFIYMNIDNAAKLLRTGKSVHGIRIKYTDLFIAKSEIKQDLLRVNSALNKEYNSDDWTNAYGTLFRAIKMEKFLVSLLLYIVILVAVFNVISMLVTTINDKKSQIAILMTLGATRTMISSIFLMFGTMIGIAGMLSGLFLGLLITTNLGSLIELVELTFKISLLDAYFINYFPIDIRPSWVVTICFSSVLLTIISSLFPAKLASNLDPASVLRHE